MCGAGGERVLALPAGVAVWASAARQVADAVRGGNTTERADVEVRA